MTKQDNMNFIEWDKKHRHTLIRLTGDEDDQEIRLNKMKASEAMYETLKRLRTKFTVTARMAHLSEGLITHELEATNKALVQAEVK